MADQGGDGGALRWVVAIIGALVIVTFALRGDLTLGTFIALAFVTWLASLFV